MSTCHPSADLSGELKSADGESPLWDYETLALRYLRSTPLALALFRIAELRPLVNRTLPRPILDLGCGTGIFARACLRDPIEWGLDKSPAVLQRAHASGLYGKTILADAEAMPLPSSSLGTVVSISVLEHIEHLDEVIREVFRVLRPGGLLVATVVLADLHDHLNYPLLLRRIGCPRLAQAYSGVHDRVFRHVSLLPEAGWRSVLEAARFEVVEARQVVSPEITRAFDLLTPLGLIYRLGAIADLPSVPRPRWWCRFWWKRFAPMVAADCSQGSCLFIVARKPSIDRPPL